MICIGNKVTYTLHTLFFFFTSHTRKAQSQNSVRDKNNCERVFAVQITTHLVAMLYFLLLCLFYLFSFPSVDLFSPEWLSNKERKPVLRFGGTDTSVSLQSCLSSNPFLVAWNIWMVMKRHEQFPDNQPREKNAAKRKATNVSGCVLFQSYFSTTSLFFFSELAPLLRVFHACIGWRWQRRDGRKRGRETRMWNRGCWLDLSQRQFMVGIIWLKRSFVK